MENMAIPVTAENQDAITARNAATSPLLKLPTEIRLRVWEFAVGSHVVEFIMTAKPSESYRFQGLVHPLFSPPDKAAPAKVLCRDLAQGIRRQIYTESFHFHLAHNIFRVRCFHVYTHLLDGLSRVQRESVRELSFGYAGWYAKRYRDVLFERNGRLVRDALPNLKRIYVDPSALQNDPELAQKTGVEIAAALVGVDIESVPKGELVILDVLDPASGIEDARVFQI